LSPKEGQEVVDFLSNKYLNVERKRAALVEHLVEHGYTETLFGFRVYRPAIWSGPGAARNHARRSVMPDLIQGTAAGVMKVWLWRVSQAIHSEGLDDLCYILLTIHDEIVFTMAPEVVERVVALCQAAMDGIIPVHIPVETKTGKNWTDMRDT